MGYRRQAHERGIVVSRRRGGSRNDEHGEVNWNTDDRDNRDSGQRPRRVIERWDVVETIVDAEAHVGTMPIRFVAEITQPIFNDKSVGYRNVCGRFVTGDHFLRVNSAALKELMTLIVDNKATVLGAIEETESSRLGTMPIRY